MIDAHEGRAVHTFDIPGAYLHTSFPDDKVVHMKCECEFVEIMCKVDPEYEIFVIYEKKKNVLYVLILKAIYGIIYSALIWYDLFSTTLSYFGIKLNPCERCIANKVIDEHQFTMGLFVDNKKVSHMDENDNSMIDDMIEEKFGKLSRIIG